MIRDSGKQFVVGESVIKLLKITMYIRVTQNGFKKKVGIHRFYDVVSQSVKLPPPPAILKLLPPSSLN